jgi:hypothetical protein
MIKTNERPLNGWLIVAIILQLLDLVTFALVLPSVGISAESNTIMARLYGISGLFGVAVVKLGVIGYLILILPRLRTLGPVAVGATALIGLLGMTTNLLSWWIVTQ